jgi:CRISPR-associated protein Csd2
MMAPRGLYVFSHEKKLGNASAHQLFDRISVKLKHDISVPRQFGDYTVAIDEKNLPAGVHLTRLVED